MPAKAKKTAQSSAAHDVVAARGAPAGLDSFLGGFVANAGAGGQAEHELGNAIGVQLRLLNKSNDTTKLKAIEDLTRRFAESHEETVAPFASNLSECIIRHVHHGNALVRAAMFGALFTFVSRGRSAKRALAPELAHLSGPWVMAMHDMEATVRTQARRAFEEAFSADKRAAMLAMYADNILAFLMETVDTAAGSGGALRDDALDPRANQLFSCLCAIGYMAKQVSAAQARVSAFVQGGDFARLIPSTEKSYIAAKTPLVRSATLALLRDVVSVCPCAPKTSASITRALAATVADLHVAVASRMWELLLLWCKTGPSEAVAHFPSGFLDAVIDSFMACTDPMVAEVVFPCLLPFLAIVSKEAQCEDALDEFCGALVEKLGRLRDTPNVSASEFSVVLSALMECWELYCVRRGSSADKAEECVELFTVILTNVCMCIQQASKRQRYLHRTAETLSATLVRTCKRNEPLFRHCLSVLVDAPGAPFSALPADGDNADGDAMRNGGTSEELEDGTGAETSAPATAYTRAQLVSSLEYLQAAVLSRLCRVACGGDAAASAATPGASASDAETVFRKTGVATCSSAINLVLSRGASNAILLGFLLPQLPRSWSPEPEVLRALLESFAAVVSAAETADPEFALPTAASPTTESTPSSPVSPTAVPATCTAPSLACVEAILQVYLRWTENDPDASAALVALTRSAASGSLEGAVQDHLLQNPEHLRTELIAGCGQADFGKVRNCVNKMVQMNTVLYEQERAAVLEAVAASLRHALSLVTESETDSDEGDSEEDEEGVAASAKGSAAADDSAQSSGDESQGSSGAGESEGGDDSEAHEEGQHHHHHKKENGDNDSNNDDAPRDPECDNADNLAPLVLQQLTSWCELLANGAPLAAFLALAPGSAAVAEQLVPAFTSLLAAITPRVLPEHHLSIKALRLCLADEDEDVLTAAIDREKHFLKANDYSELVDTVSTFLSGHAVPTEVLDAAAETALESLTEPEPPLSRQGFNQIQQAVPFASTAVLRQFCASPETWEAFSVEHSPSEDDKEEFTVLSLFDGYFPLAHLDLSLWSGVRTAQLLRLLDHCDVLSDPTSTLAPDDAVTVFCVLLEAAAARETFAEIVNDTLFGKLLPQAFATVFESADLAERTATRLFADPDKIHLVATLGAVTRAVAVTEVSPEQTAFLLRARRAVTAVTSKVLALLFDGVRARGVSAALGAIVSTYFRAMDETADLVKDNMLAHVSKEEERLVCDACAALPSWDAVTARLVLVLHRHLSSMPVVPPVTVKGIIAYAQTLKPLVALETLAELANTRILDVAAFAELSRVMVNSMCRCYNLAHLPSNGRLMQVPVRPGIKPVVVSFEELRRVVVASVLARRGVVVHSRMDDVLRSTVNLIVFDTVCEAVSRLRQTTSAEAPLLVQLIASTSSFMSELLTSDVTVLRSSEISAQQIATVFCFAYRWLHATSIAKLEAIGLEAVAAVMRSISSLANLTLAGSPFSLRAQMLTIIERHSLKPLRDTVTASAPAKITVFRRQNQLIQKTHKQKLLLFPYCLAWCIYLTTPPPSSTDGAAAAVSAGLLSEGSTEWRARVMQLLDLIGVLLLTPVFDSKSTRIESTFLGLTLGAGGSPTSPTHGGGFVAVGALGFEAAALTRVGEEGSMGNLARGAAALLSLLLRGATLGVVKSWLDTLERKMRVLVCGFVEQHISPTLTQESLSAVLSHAPDGGTDFSISDSFRVRVSLAQHRVTLEYENDEVSIGLRISYPASFPLSSPSVEPTNTRASSVSADKWRAWMVKMTVMLFGASANVWDCVELFQRNIEAHFEGREPCPICFAIVNAVDHKLPEMRCSVCHNSAFHSNCLSTWWANGGENVCPLCRSPWVTE